MGPKYSILKGLHCIDYVSREGSCPRGRGGGCFTEAPVCFSIIKLSVSNLLSFQKQTCLANSSTAASFLCLSNNFIGK